MAFNLFTPHTAVFLRIAKVFVCWLALSAQALAADPVYFADITMTERYQRLLEQVRCLVCQNQSLSDSNADLAEDLRQQIGTMIKNNRSDKEIFDYLLVRYGDFILYQPRFQKNTWLLWLAPLIFLIFGSVFGLIILRLYLGKQEPEV